MAFQLTDAHDWAKVGEAQYMVAEVTSRTTNVVLFKAYEEPQVNDWIVRLTAEDTYHVTDTVFRERNVVSE